jgi:TfoX/Sxy family transcriptional regulator of competence genes
MANKKINQLVSKTAILSTDLFGIGDATTGQLFKKTIAELQAAIGGAVISVNGLVGTVVLDTDDIQELATPTNKYFTDARARGAISLTVTGNSGASTYSSGTGVLNVPTYTLAGLGGITATFLSGGAGISYNSTTGVISYSGTIYTDVSIRALFSGSTGITYNSTTGAISYSGTVYTDSSVRALISITTTGDSGASTYNNTTGVINVPNYTLAGLGGISLTSLSGGTGITYNNTTGAISYSGTVYTDASVRALISATGNISYNSTTGVISTSLTQYTDALARASISLTTTGTSGASTYNSTTGVLNVPQYAAALSGTTNYIPKFTSSTTIGNSIIYDNGTNIGISQANPFGGATSLTGIAFSDRGGIFKLTVNNAIYVSNNLYYDGSDWRRITANGGTIAFLSSATGGSFIIASAATGSAGSSATLTDRFEITSTGNMGFGMTPYDNGLSKGFDLVGGGGMFGFSNNFYLSGNGYFTDSWRYKAAGALAIIEMSSSGVITFATAGSGSINAAASPTEKMRLSNDGNLLVGTTVNNGERIYVSGNIRATGTITANSDIRIKSNITKIENALEKVGQISGYTYNTNYDDKRHGGVIAQEIDKVFPEIVNTGNDGLMGVEYGNISALLIEAIKEQNTKIKNLETLLASK